MASMHFEVTRAIPGRASRCGRLQTARGVIETPAFMPVGTLGAVKGIAPFELQSLGFGLILNNAYHLYLRPGVSVVRELGGVHAFASWPSAILTDSGGFQVFSLAKIRKVSDEGVTFQSHLDGMLHHITPEQAIEIQAGLGADIIMTFDECVGLPAGRADVEAAVERTAVWARRCQASHRREDQALFGIVQGGLEADLRKQAARDLVGLHFDGYAIGGLSVGEDKSSMYGMLDVTVPELPLDKPRYLMGVGMPEDLVEGVARGVDLFDCVVPTRHGRTGWLFTRSGRVMIKQAQYARDPRPIDSDCSCSVCRTYSRAYLHHLFHAKEMLGLRLNTLHNLAYFASLMRAMREAIAEGRFDVFRRDFYQQRGATSNDGDDESNPLSTTIATQKEMRV
ncbi:queuine tRNA-ribosyltransferase [Nitrospira sp.]|nr:queuine tRNA-ribosyltransferase [Nitrospira sp.]